ncbi:MAG: hypothetical protein DWQ19_11895 [Crenarchaeota archaeon]|nr:MAG: hypothetical protein DWQ19_11895 [Thermoproteota archaeon]
MKFSLGTDPEFMLSKNGKIYSAIGVVKGTKNCRKKLGKHSVYYDNVLAECAVRPGKSKEDFITNLQDCIQQYAEHVHPYRLLPKAAHYFSQSQLQHPHAMKIGCMPEMCAYQMEKIIPDETLLENTRLRTAGGHVHVGSTILRDNNCFVSIFLLDLFLGLPSIYIDGDTTTKTRKKLYGQTGRHRIPPYGVEYRTLGNFWLASPERAEFVYDTCEFVLKFIKEGRWKELWQIDEKRLDSYEAWTEPDFHPSQCYKCVGYDVDKLRKIVDASNTSKGQEFLNYIKNFLPSELYSKIFKLSKNRPKDLYEEWKINVGT